MKKKAKKVSNNSVKNIIKRDNNLREYVSKIALSRFKTIRKTNGKVFAMSPYCILKAVFGINSKNRLDDINMSYAIYLIIQGVKIEKISSLLGINNNTLKSQLRAIYNDCDVAGAYDLINKILLWVLQQSGILILPSDEKVIKPLTEEELKNLII